MGRAIDNARTGFAAFLLGEPLPAPFFPAKAEAVKLAPVKPTGRDYDALHAWMAEHPEPTEGDVTQRSGKR